MDIAKLHGDEPFADRCFEEATVLRRNLETHGWDGESLILTMVPRWVRRKMPSVRLIRLLKGVCTA